MRQSPLPRLTELENSVASGSLSHICPFSWAFRFEVVCRCTFSMGPSKWFRGAAKGPGAPVAEFKPGVGSTTNWV